MDSLSGSFSIAISLLRIKNGKAVQKKNIMRMFKTIMTILNPLSVQFRSVPLSFGDFYAIYAHNLKKQIPSATWCHHVIKSKFPH